MKPAPFEYHVPGTLDEALTLMHEHAGEAKLLAGGQSLVPAMNFRVVQPAMLIDLNRVAELNYVRQEGEAALRIGAMTRERQLEFDPLIEKRLPLLKEASAFVAHPQIRNRGTLGGSLANADPAAELPVIMLALGARLKARSSKAERWVAAQDFFSGMFTTDLAPDEILVEIELPSIAPRTGWSFMEVAPRPGDYALMGVAVVMTLDEDGNCQQARLVYLNAGDGPVEVKQTAAVLAGQKPTESIFKEAAALASGTEIDPFGNIHASPEFQRHLANMLTQRALKVALERAREGRRQ
jgi:aerobic carbon-monoxide dehydrogenase medium subunit